MAVSEEQSIVRTRPRGRPRKVDILSGPNANVLRIRRVDSDTTITLQLSGSLELANLLALREAAFTAIGSRPAMLYMDLRSVLSVEIAAINSLVTIGRVASLMKVGFHIVPSVALRETLMQTGLFRLLPPPPAEEEALSNELDKDTQHRKTLDVGENSTDDSADELQED
jgi:anti-anti-sigma regulatory factor